MRKLTIEEQLVAYTVGMVAGIFVAGFLLGLLVGWLIIT